jgi:hypothetical protein
MALLARTRRGTAALLGTTGVLSLLLGVGWGWSVMGTALGR